MPELDTLFDDIVPSYEAGEDASATRVTIVHLPQSASTRRKFMRHLQSHLAGKYAESALTPMPEHEGHALGCASERFIRAQLGLQAETSDAQWCNTLKSWGAIRAQILLSDAFKAMLDRRRTALTQAAPTKVFLSPDEIASKPTVTPPSAAGVPQAGSLAVAANAKIDWHLDHRGANVVAAWQKFLDRQLGTNELPWINIRVGHLDTGYIQHEALAWDTDQSTTILHNQGHDYFAIPNDADSEDAWLPGFPGHGTRIDGAIAGYDPRNASQPFYGAAPGVQIIPYRVTDSVMVDHVPGNIANAIDQAVSDGCEVITICLGALRGSKRVASAVDRAYERGTIVVCAAGQVWPWVIYPGRFNRVMTVSGIGPSGAPWGSAACGKYVDWCGPADEIRRLKIKPNAAGYETGINPKADGDGTSYATAITSGIAAMWLAWHGAQSLRNKYAGCEWMIPAAFKKLVKTSCKALATAPADGYGAGIIDASALLNQLLPEVGSLKIEAPASDPIDYSH